MDVFYRKTFATSKHTACKSLSNWTVEDLKKLVPRSPAKEDKEKKPRRKFTKLQAWKSGQRLMQKMRTDSKDAKEQEPSTKQNQKKVTTKLGNLDLKNVTRAVPNMEYRVNQVKHRRTQTATGVVLTPEPRAFSKTPQPLRVSSNTPLTRPAVAPEMTKATIVSHKMLLKTGVARTPSLDPPPAADRAVTPTLNLRPTFEHGTEKVSQSQKSLQLHKRVKAKSGIFDFSSKNL